MPAFRKVNPNKTTSKCNQKVIDAMCNYLRLGAYPETAAVMAGISKETFLQWMKRAHKTHKEYKKIYADCLHAVQHAMEEATVRDLNNIDKCAMGTEVEYMRGQSPGKDANGKFIPGPIIFSETGKPIVLKPGSARDWSASAWRLERRSKDWNKTDRKELSGPDGAPIQTQSTPDDPEIVKARVKSKIAMMKEILGE